VLVVLALLDAALGSGASVTRSLVGVGEVLGAGDGRALRTVGAALSFGSGWDAAWVGLPPHLAPVRDCLYGSWVTGSAAGPIIRAAIGQVRRRRRGEAREASARLAVRLVLPLGLCFLPACLLLGLVPIVLSLAGDMW
ncbi:MAG TPA: secretion system protein, partial [Cellulomonadaceae bacterium]|nr:secretion system protein [Cellulomonadaceae bacterium]